MNKPLFYTGLGFFLLEILMAIGYGLTQVESSTLYAFGFVAINLMAALFMLVGSLKE